jgi:hypothetical protein
MPTMPTWICSDEGEMPLEISAASAEEAAQVFVSEADWPTKTRTYWIEVLVSEPAIEDREVEGEYFRVAIEPVAPDCDDGSAHAWEDGGVWGHGGGQVITERCTACGLQKLTDTWATDRVSGQQGLDSIEYLTPDDDADDADRWHCDGCERDYNDATPTGVAADGTTYCPTCAVAAACAA